MQRSLLIFSIISGILLGVGIIYPYSNNTDDVKELIEPEIKCLSLMIDGEDICNTKEQGEDWICNMDKHPSERWIVTLHDQVMSDSFKIIYQSTSGAEFVVEDINSSSKLQYVCIKIKDIFK